MVLFASLISSSRPCSMNRVTLAMTRQQALSLRT
jgi:hypothetical protein